METVTNVENALIKGATRRQNFSEINKIPEEEEEEGSVHLQGGVRRQVSSSRFIAKAVTERTPAAEWAAATRPSLKSLPDSFSPWPVAICKVQRRISQGPSYRVTVRATKCYDSPIISATIPYANDPLNNDFLSVGKRHHDFLSYVSKFFLDSYSKVFSNRANDTRRGVVAKRLQIRHSRHLRVCISKFLCPKDECCQRLRIVRTIILYLT